MSKFKISVKTIGKTQYGNEIQAVICEPYHRVTDDGRNRVLDVLRATEWKGRFWTQNVDGKSRLVYSKVDANELKAIFESLPKDAWTKPENKPTKVKTDKVKEVVKAEKTETDKQIAAMLKQIQALTKLVKSQATTEETDDFSEGF